MEKDAKQPPLPAITHTSLVVRLVLDGRGQVQRGALVDLHGKVVGRFQQLEELPVVVSRWLSGALSAASEQIIDP